MLRKKNKQKKGLVNKKENGNNYVIGHEAQIGLTDCL